MMDMKPNAVSKFLSLILRHKPEVINITLDKNGWADIGEIITKSKKIGKYINIADVFLAVKNNNKQRFALSDDNKRIRANQGHSINVDVELEEATPPDMLFHGTKLKTYELIKITGIKKMNRQHVHLSEDVNTASTVASRRSGSSLIIKVRAGLMHKSGIKFYLSKNGVWLTDYVDPKFIE